MEKGLTMEFIKENCNTVGDLVRRVDEQDDPTGELQERFCN